MSKKVLIILLSSFIAVSAACQDSSSPNVNTTSNSNVANQANIPPEFSTVPVTPSGNATPGIPDPSTVNMNSLPKGATPTPGIPDPKTIGKTPLPKGATPTPGIPDEKTLREQMNRQLGNANIVNSAGKTVRDLEKTITNRVKTVRKP
jgi:hypothetical protein